MLCTHCASEALPGGGPPDKTPPQVVFQTIKDAATNVDSQQSLIFTFSERLNPDQIEKNTSLFPLKDDLFNISYKNKSIEISPTAIYTLIFEKGISDLRSNTLREPFQFTFTTGSYMPDNTIKGKILDMSEKKTATIYLSRNYSSPDSIILSPEYFPHYLYFQCKIILSLFVFNINFKSVGQLCVPASFYVNFSI